MSGHESPAGLWPADGAGVLARQGGLILLSSLPDTRLPDQLLDLLAEVANAGGDGLRFMRGVEAALEADGSWRLGLEGQESPAVVAFGETGRGLAVCVTGAAWAEITTSHGTQRLAGQPAILMRCLVGSAVLTIRGGLGGHGNEARTDQFSYLGSGAVRAGGFLYHAAQSGPGTPKAAELSRDEPPRETRAEHKEFAAAAVEPPAAVVQPPAAPVVEPPAAVVQPPAAPVVEPPAAVVQPPAAAVVEPLATVVELPAAAVEPPAPVVEPAAPAAEPAGETIEPETSESPAVPAAPPERVPSPAGTPEPFDSVLLLGGEQRGGAATRVSLPLTHDQEHESADSPAVPQIRGVYCKNGHFDDPEARFCAICGISMNQKTLIPETGPRPPLGLLVLDTGHIFQLDTDYIIGREPTLNADVAAGTARPLRIADDTGTVSRVHAKIQLDGWHVLVTDLGSANGTRVQLANKATDQRLTPREPVRLRPGSRVDLGVTGFRYESHRGR